MVLINRRGYSWFLLYTVCSTYLQCQSAASASPITKAANTFECAHYYSFAMRVPKACPKCAKEYCCCVGEGADAIEDVSAINCRMPASPVSIATQSTPQRQLSEGPRRIRRRRN